MVQDKRASSGEHGTSRAGDAAREPKRLRDEAKMAIEEARMVLPGIQALFGFQLIAVFSDGFRELAAPERLAHLGSLLLVAVAIALIMTPAAYDRIVDEREFSRRSIRLASRVITGAMVPLTVGLAIEIYVVASLVIDPRFAVAAAVLLALLFALLWFLLPWLRRARSSKRAGSTGTGAA